MRASILNWSNIFRNRDRTGLKQMNLARREAIGIRDQLRI